MDDQMSDFIYFLDNYKTKHVGFLEMNQILYNINSDFLGNKYYDKSFVGQTQNPFYMLYDASKWNEHMNQTHSTNNYGVHDSIQSGTNNHNNNNNNNANFSAYDMWKKTHETNILMPDKLLDIVPVVKTSVYIDISVNSLSDLIEIIDKYKYSDANEYNIDLKSLTNIRVELVELNNMIGMTSLKSSILDQLFYFIQELHICKKLNDNVDSTSETVTESNNSCANPQKTVNPSKLKFGISKCCERNVNEHALDESILKLKIKPDVNGTSDFKHTVICGPPGTGKTEVAKIIGRMYSKIGVLKKNIFKKVTRSDLVAGYLGQTALKTKTVVTDSLGGVLFIDEAYSLGNNRDTDSYSKECIDTLCEAMSDHKDDLMVIIAGYEEELAETFFSVNKGLESRFIWRFKIDEYDAAELTLIFKKKITETDWSFENVDEIQTKWFEQRKREFRHYGRDMELLFSFAKISHAKRVYGKPVELRKKISLDDLNKGYDTFIKNKKQKNKSTEIFGLYV